MPETTEQVEHADKGYVKFQQSEVKYDANGGTLNPRSQACSTCRWFHRLYEDGQYLGHDCLIVDSYPAEILPTGWCDQWAKTPQTDVPVLQSVQPVVIVENIELELDEYEVGTMARKLEDESYGGAVLNLKKELDNLWETIRSVVPGRKRSDDQFMAFKALGNGLWFATFSNNFLDRDGEIISEKAWDRYIARVQSGYAPMPELWLAHIRGTKHGQAHWVGKAGHMIYAAGKFDDTEQGRAAEKYYQGRKGDITMSHAFMYPVWAKKTDDMPDGVKAVYEDLTVFEITTLEPGEEANPFTDFKTLEELEAMPISDKERARIKDVFKDAADKVLANVETAEKAGEIFREIGTAYKSYTDVTEQTETAEKGVVDPIGAELLSDVLMAQGDAATALKGIEGKALAIEKAATAEMTALKARVAQLEALLETTKHAAPASEAAGTVVAPALDLSKLTPEMLAVLPAEVKTAFEAIAAKQGDGQEYDPFFGDLKVKRSGR